MLVIRLRAQGCHKKKSFRIVVADKRSPRDGKYMEMLGWYHPYEVEGKRFEFYETEKNLDFWVTHHGAQMTDVVKQLVKRSQLAPGKLQEISADRKEYKKKRTVRQASEKK